MKYILIGILVGIMLSYGAAKYILRNDSLTDFLRRFDRETKICISTNTREIYRGTIAEIWLSKPYYMYFLLLSMDPEKVNVVDGTINITIKASVWTEGKEE